ncbi:MAG: OmpA family protein [Pseudooceanicola sp.]
MTNTIRWAAKVIRRAGIVRFFALAGLVFASPAMALDLSVPPSARATLAQTASPDSFALPIGPFADGVLPVLEVEGSVTRRAWQISVQGTTSLQLLKPLRDQIVAAGYVPILECADRACGGFDFRYAADIIDAPAMQVDLFDYRVFTAHLGAGPDTRYVMILTSRTTTAGYIQLVLITPQGEDSAGLAVTGDGKSVTTPDPVTTPATSDIPLATRLETDGHAILTDLEFETGSSQLNDGRYASLESLAEYLLANPDRRIALVGHTDTQGALDGNIALSRRRAQSVLERLVKRLGVARGQLDAEGMGYLAPVAANLTAQGRERNRRVEAVLLNTQ